MKLSRKKVVRAALVALAAVALALPAWAGQVNLSSRTTTINESVLETVISTNGVSTITASTLISPDGASTVTTQILNTIQILESFVGSPATVSFEVAQDDINYTSPFDNLVMTPTISQSPILIQSTAGITNAQVTAGAGNVSVASNGLIDGSLLFQIVGSLSANGGGSLSAGATQAAVLALTPGFALQNSNANALVQAAAVAVAGSGEVGGAGAVTAIDVQQSGLNEYSPHGNMALISTGGILQSITVSATSGITNAGIQAGAGNVQAAHNLLVFGSPSSFSGTLLPGGG
jgi:hypothetical protein